MHSSSLSFVSQHTSCLWHAGHRQVLQTIYSHAAATYIIQWAIHHLLLHMIRVQAIKVAEEHLEYIHYKERQFTQHSSSAILDSMSLDVRGRCVMHNASLLCNTMTCQPMSLLFGLTMKACCCAFHQCCDIARLALHNCYAK